MRIAPQPTTVLLCIVCILVTFAHSTTRAGDPGLWAQMGHFTDVDSDQIWNGHYSPLFTNMFLHADFTHGLGITHLLYDVMWLYQLGCLCELAIGPVWYILFFAAAAVVGSCSELAVSGTVGIGASGVVYALFGFMWAGRYKYPEWQTIANRWNLQVMIGWGLYCIFTTYTHMMNVANGAHSGGLAFGYCLGVLCFDRGRWRWPLIAPLAALLTICALSLTYMPWSGSWLWWKAEKAFNAQRYPEAAAYFARSARHGAPADDAWNNVAVSWHNQSIDDNAKGNVTAATRDLENEADAAAKSNGEYDMNHK